MSSRFKLDATHFLSIPMQGDHVVNNFKNFKEGSIHEFKVDKDLFQSVEKLHLTIGMLHLLDDEEISLAGQILQQAKNRMIELGLLADDLEGELRGLEYMNDDPRLVNVLYAKINLLDANDNRLQTLCDELVDIFVNQGWMRKEHDSVKLHVTVMNSRYAKNVRAFDITDILTKYKGYEFGRVTLSSVHLSERFSTNASNKFFKSAGCIDLTINNP